MFPNPNYYFNQQLTNNFTVPGVHPQYMQPMAHSTQPLPPPPYQQYPNSSMLYQHGSPPTYLLEYTEAPRSTAGGYAPPGQSPYYLTTIIKLTNNRHTISGTYGSVMQTPQHPQYRYYNPTNAYVFGNQINQYCFANNNQHSSQSNGAFGKCRGLGNGRARYYTTSSLAHSDTSSEFTRGESDAFPSFSCHRGAQSHYEAAVVNAPNLDNLPTEQNMKLKHPKVEFPTTFLYQHSFDDYEFGVENQEKPIVPADLPAADTVDLSSVKATTDPKSGDSSVCVSNEETDPQERNETLDTVHRAANVSGSTNDDTAMESSLEVSSDSADDENVIEEISAAPTPKFADTLNVVKNNLSDELGILPVERSLPIDAQIAQTQSEGTKSSSSPALDLVDHTKILKVGTTAENESPPDHTNCGTPLISSSSDDSLAPPTHKNGRSEELSNKLEKEISSLTLPRNESQAITSRSHADVVDRPLYVWKMGSSSRLTIGDSLRSSSQSSSVESWIASIPSFKTTQKARKAAERAQHLLNLKRKTVNVLGKPAATGDESNDESAATDHPKGEKRLYQEIQDSVDAYLHNHRLMREDITEEKLSESSGILRQLLHFHKDPDHHKIFKTEQITEFLSHRHQQHDKNNEEKMAMLFFILKKRCPNDILQVDASFFIWHEAEIETLEKEYLSLVLSNQ